MNHDSVIFLFCTFQSLILSASFLYPSAHSSTSTGHILHSYHSADEDTNSLKDSCSNYLADGSCDQFPITVHPTDDSTHKY